MIWRWANRDTIVAGAGRFLLEKEEAEAIAARVFSTVAAKWEGLLRRVGVSQAECEIVRGAFLYGGLELPA